MEPEEGSEMTTEKGATSATEEDEEDEEVGNEIWLSFWCKNSELKRKYLWISASIQAAEEEDSAKADRVSGDKKWRLSKKPAAMLHGSRVVKKARRAKGNVKVKVSRKDDEPAEKVDPEEYEEEYEER